MRYCPDCRRIYRTGVETCPDCGTEIVEQEQSEELAAPAAPPAHEGGSDLTVVYTAPDQPVAEIVQGLLEAEGIHVLVHSEDSAILPILDPRAEDWGEILVPAADAAHAREVIAAYLSGRVAEADLEDEEEEDEEGIEF